MRGRLRILLVTGEYPPLPGGIGDYTANLREALSAIGVETTVLSSGGAHGAGVQTTHRWGWTTYRRIASIVRQAKIDTVHVQYQAGAYDMHVAVNLLPGVLRARLHLPVVTTFHDLRPPFLFPKAGPARQLMVLRMARHSTRVVTTNPGDETVLARAGIASTCIPIGPNLPPPARTFDDFPLQRVGFFGFPTRSKGIADLIAALGSLETTRRVELHLIGDQGTPAPTNDIMARDEVDRLAARAGVPLVRTGRLSAQQASDALAACAVIALPFRAGASQRSGSLLAALQTGRPVVTTAPAHASTLGGLSGMPQLTLALRGDAEDLCEAIRLALQSPPAAAALPREYQWHSIAERHLHLYTKM